MAEERAAGTVSTLPAGRQGEVENDVNPGVAERWAFPPDAASSREARRRVLDVLEASRLDAAAATAALVVSELATNAVLHAGTPFEVRVRIMGDVVRIEVHDGTRRRPAARLFSNEATSGRGLRLVEQLCRAWGVEVSEAGKTVWAELALDAPLVLEPVFDFDSVDEL